VKATDPLARLELADSQGTVLRTGRKELVISGLDSGFYRARLIAPEGQVVEKIVDLSPGEENEVSLNAPQPSASPLLRAITNSAEFKVLEDNTLDVSETVGPLASAQLSTVLALAGSMLNQSEKWGHRLRSLGLKSFQESVDRGTTSGLHILTGVEADGSGRALARLSSTKLRLWPIRQRESELSDNLISESRVTGLHEFARAAKPGQYFLSMEPLNEQPVVFAVSILTDRVTMLVFHYDAEGKLHFFQYNLSLSSEPSKKLDHEQIRRLELAQRFYLSGRLDYALDEARDLLYAKWVDPLAGCLGCYLLLRLGRASELSEASNNMVKFYEELCDSHLLKGEYEASAGNRQAARRSYMRALDVGVPIFADGLTRLFEALKRFELQNHPRARLISEIAHKRVRGFLWTAWMPSKEVRQEES
jgi:hypothetical protein